MGLARLGVPGRDPRGAVPPDRAWDGRRARAPAPQQHGQFARATGREI